MFLSSFAVFLGVLQYTSLMFSVRREMVFYFGRPEVSAYNKHEEILETYVIALS